MKIVFDMSNSYAASGITEMSRKLQITYLRKYGAIERSIATQAVQISPMADPEEVVIPILVCMATYSSVIHERRPQEATERDVR